MMKTMTESEARGDFGKLLDLGKREPVIITSRNQPLGVFMSLDDLEDTIWAEKALKAHAGGYLSSSESEALLDALINAKD